MKVKFAILLALAVSCLVPVSAFAQKKPHIVVVTHGQVSDSFWLVVKNGVEQAAKDSGSEVEYRAPRLPRSRMASLSLFLTRTLSESRFRLL